MGWEDCWFLCLIVVVVGEVDCVFFDVVYYFECEWGYFGFGVLWGGCIYVVGGVEVVLIES